MFHSSNLTSGGIRNHFGFSLWHISNWNAVPGTEHAKWFLLVVAGGDGRGR